MKPTIYMWGAALSSYGLLALAGAAAAILLALWHSRLRGLQRDDVFYAALFACIGAAAGGKLTYLLTVLPALTRNWAVLSESIPDMLPALLTGGFVYYGGLFGAMAGIYLYARRYRLPPAAMLDVFVPSAALFHAFGRVGCLLAGCCYGVAYGGAGAVELAGALRFPVQMVEAGVNLLLAAALACLLRRGLAAGRVTAIYLMSYGGARFMLEYLRGDAERGFWFGLSTSQWLSLLAFGMGCYFWQKHEMENKSRKTEI